MPADGRHFDSWLVEYMKYTQYSEAPNPLHFWTGVSMIAGALRRRVWIDQRHFQWTPNFYIIFVAPPGVATKSTTINTGTALLRRIDGVKFGPNSMTWQGLTVALEEANTVVQFDDRTLPMSCLTIPVSELGTFLKTRDNDLIDVLTNMWDGELTVWRHRIKNPQPGQNAETAIVNPWMNIIGCTTPAWMRQNFPAYIIEGGLTSRCIFVFASAKRQFIPYPASMIPEAAYEAFGNKLVEDLQRIADISGPFTLAEDAVKWGEDWYVKHWSSPTNGIGDRYLGYLARKQTHIHKLALVMSAAERNDRVILLKDIMAAERMITALEADMQRLFSLVGVVDSAKQTGELLEFIRANGNSSYREAWRAFMPFMNERDFASAVKGLVTAGHILMTKNERDETYLVAFNQPTRTMEAG